MKKSTIGGMLKTETSNGKDPKADSLFNLIDRTRLDSITVLAKRLKIDPNTISEERFDLTVDELSNAGADEILEILSELDKQKKNGEKKRRK